jgi:IS30 family transposase
MKRKTRINYSEAQKAEMWDRWQRGESLKSIGRLFDRGSGSIYGILSVTGGIRPPPRTRSNLALTLNEREEISRGVALGHSLRSIATQVGRSPSTISREINRNGSYDDYRATQADQAAWDRAHRPKPCKLAGNRFLSRTVAEKLRLLWSPQQIAGWLKIEFPGEEHNHVSHETIYRSLFIQARGVLKKELIQHLRTKRTMRRSKHASLKHDGLGKITGTLLQA